MEPFTLHDLTPGQTATVHRLLHTGGMRRRLQEIGLLPGTPVTCLGYSPGGDPGAYQILDAVIAIRWEDGCQVLLRPPGDAPSNHQEGV